MVINELKKQGLVTFKEPEEKVFKRSVELIHGEYELEKQVEREAKAMVDDLEKKQGGGFERHRMYVLIKNELAKKKGLVL